MLDMVHDPSCRWLQPIAVRRRIACTSDVRPVRCLHHLQYILHACIKKSSPCCCSVTVCSMNVLLPSNVPTNMLGYIWLITCTEIRPLLPHLRLRRICCGELILRKTDSRCTHTSAMHAAILGPGSSAMACAQG